MVKKYLKTKKKYNYMNKKVIGMVLSIAGLALVAVASIPSIGIKIPFASKYVLVAGLGAVIVGVILTFDKGSSKVKHATEEVPIYEGVGKNRKIVGYRKN